MAEIKATYIYGENSRIYHTLKWHYILIEAYLNFSNKLFLTSTIMKQ